MNTRHASRCLCVASAILMTALCYSRTANTQSPVATSGVRTSGGLTVVTFKVNPGTIRVNFPDDMRAGDTISGTVFADPNGKTKEEQTANQTELKKFGIQLIDQTEDKPQDVALGDVSVIFKYTLVNNPQSGNVLTVGLLLNAGGVLAQAKVPLTGSGAVITPDPKITPPTGMTPSGAVITPDPKITQPGTTPSGETLPPNQRMTPPSDLPLAPKYFDLPLLGQTGRPMVITGPFDGNASNTSVNFRTDRNIDWDKVKRSVTDFEKPSQNVFGGFGLIAESPRKAVFEAPPNVVGAVEVLLNEGPTEKIGRFRNLRLDLTAPKTSLVRGESTELKISVSGLEGLTQPVPLTLTSEGVITMDGGPFQQLTIEPKQVDNAGQFTTFRRVTGLQAGGWGATATVVTHPYNFCLQDDASPNRVVQWNTFTGDYLFECPTCFLPPSPKAGDSGAQSSTGQTGAGPALTGKGQMKMKGCIITLTHNAPDRRVFATLDPCSSSGTTTVENPAAKTKFVITDRNIADSTCFPPPSK
ncbi:MAG: hypothetical protein ACXW18_10365 [Pyrinomonadaceae bacterium]